ncbi:protein-glucosylgalactosylhydroxylysine glucosidase isoform X4 [Alligator sinensis]|uniref:Protein-glucosylgalactosylhydroxylysine glucosidase isoform X4 n=1 Tax=Alligator sinensis TaxID=38654 RepID=A0A3Q0FSR1_ALLSI|nr:protein-glucosylgalactosylhydroxylysine glucosidase isoform X4 [Alligator sinensis]
MANSGDDPTVFSCTALPSDSRLLPTVTNAYLGTRVYRDILHVNGIYNGAVGDTHRADVPSPINVRMKVSSKDGVTETFSLSTRTGTFSHVLQSPEYTATHRIYAHHAHVHLLAFSITIQRSTTKRQPITVQLQSQFTPKSPDVDFNRGPDYQGAQYIYGKTLIPEVEGGPQPAVHMVWTPVPQAVILLGEEQEQSWEFLTAVAESEEGVKRHFREGMSLVAAGSLYSSHTQAWAARWRGCCVDVDGPLPLKQAVYGCLYYLLSAIPPLGSSGFLFHGISPGGLSNGTQGEDYWGHVFWDQDTWMFPNILLFYPEAARAILEYRIRTLDGAMHNAQELGYKQGAKFPWESAATGREVCPEEVYGAQEIHITGDVLLAFEQYYHVTQDTKLFREDGGWNLVGAVSQYWCSRMVWSEEEQCYHIKGEHVKQADVVLLGFPMMYPMSPEVRRNDLEMYEPVTEQDGPAMTWSMFAVGWMELKEVQRAQSQLSKCFNNITEPFKIWSENSDGSGAVNFLTGMGGFLQAVLFGYTGFRITKNSLNFDPVCPDDINRIKVTGVSYLGNKLNFTITKERIRIKVTKSSGDPRSSLLEAVLVESGQRILLHEGQIVVFPTTAGWIQRASAEPF